MEQRPLILRMVHDIHTHYCVIKRTTNQVSEELHNRAEGLSVVVYGGG